MCFILSNVYSITPSPFPRRFPITFIWLLLFFFFYRRFLSIAKWWHILVSKVVSSSKSVHCGWECVINVTMSRTGLAISTKLGVWVFWYPWHVTEMSAKQVGKFLLSRLWYTNLATTTWHYFCQGAGIQGLKWVSGQFRTALQKEMFLWRVWKIVANVASFCQTPAGFSWICWVIRVESDVSSHAFRWLNHRAAPTVLVLG